MAPGRWGSDAAFGFVLQGLLPSHPIEFSTSILFFDVHGNDLPFLLHCEALNTAGQSLIAIKLQ